MSIPPVGFETFIKDLRPFGGGTPIGYKTALTDLVNGEFAAWDNTNKTLVRFVRDATAGPFVGITRDSLVGIQKLGNQPQLLAAFQNPCSVFSTGVHSLLGSAGQTYVHSTPVYMAGTDSQKITTVAGGGTQIGTVHLPDGSTLSGAVRVPVLIDEFTITQ